MKLKFIFYLLTFFLVSCDTSIKRSTYDYSTNGSTNKRTKSSRISQKEPRTDQTEKVWREELGGGMFAINIEKNGVRNRTVYGPCKMCRGSSICSTCHGMKICMICQGQGGIVTSGYGQYIACYACNTTGQCSLCNGTGKCICSNYDYPGYTPGYSTVYGANGQIISNSSYTSGTSSSRSSSSSSTRTNDYIETIEYAPNYTGESNDEWCEKCQKIAPRHSHIKKRVY